MSKYITNEILMVRPAGFHFNEQTSDNNIYQYNDGKDWADVNTIASKEFDDVVKGIRNLGIKVNVIQDTKSPSTPDSIFPNNCFTSHNGGKIIFYPMYAKNRRLEAEKYSDELKSIVREKYDDVTSIDLRNKANEGLFLEGTGSMILDRKNKIAYMALSQRSDENLFREFCDIMDYRPIVFRAVHKSNEIYHTNVLMNIGEKNAIVCFDVVDEKYRESLRKALKDSDKNVIEISVEQFEKYAGNALELKGKDAKVLLMSSTAYGSLTSSQINEIEKDCKIVCFDIPTIEYYGGGSIRCMLAEIF